MGKKAISTRMKKNLALQALESSLGIITSACKAAGIPRRTFYSWMEKDPKFAERVNEITEMAVDFTESALLKKIKEGDTTAIIFHLKTKGKNRGYGQSINVTGNLFDSLFREFNDKTDDEIKDMLKSIE